MNNDLLEITEVAGTLLSKASGFYRQVGEQNPELLDKMTVFAELYDSVAEMIRQNPQAEISFPDPEDSGREQKIQILLYASKLITDAGGFFRSVGEENPGTEEQMEHNAGICDEVAGLLTAAVEG